jgi:hypothetical protein
MVERMQRLLAMAGLALLVSGLGCSTSAQPQMCGLDAGTCSSSDICIMGGTCAQRCDTDGSAPCPAGTTCQLKGGFCSGTACSAIAVMVCL